MLSEYEIRNLIYTSQRLNRGFISILFYSPWDETSNSIVELAKTLGVVYNQEFYLVDLFEQPELSTLFQINRSPTLVVMNSSRLDVIDIPCAIIRELKYISRSNSLSHSHEV